MSEDAPVAEEPVVEESVVAEPMVNPAVAEALAAIKAEVQASETAKAEATSAEDARNTKLNEVKARVEAVIGPVTAALREATDERERAALIDLEARTYAPLKDELEAAYREWGDAGGLGGETNYAHPGENFIDSKVTVLGEAQG